MAMNHKKYCTSNVQRSVRVELHGNVMTCVLEFHGEHKAFDIDLLEVSRKFSQDHGVIAIGVENGEALIVETTAISVGLRGSPFVGTKGLERRDTPLGVYRTFCESNSFPICYLMTPTKGCDISDVTVYWFVNDGVTDIRVDGSALHADDAPIMPSFLASWLPIEVEGPSTIGPDARANFIVHAPQGAEVHLEVTAGLLNRNRARDGDTVVLTAYGVSAGTVARIKAGYKYWPSKVEHAITVSEAGGQ